MLKVADITNDPSQKFTINMKDGKRLVLEMRYLPTQNGWFMDIDYDDGAFTLKGTKVVTSYNLLLQFEYIVPFGIMILTEGNSEPFFLDDFVTGRSSMYILEDKSDFEDIKDFRGF